MHQLENEMDVIKIICVIAYALFLAMAIWSAHKKDIYGEIWYMGIAIVFANLAK